MSAGRIDAGPDSGGDDADGSSMPSRRARPRSENGSIAYSGDGPRVATIDGQFQAARQAPLICAYICCRYWLAGQLDVRRGLDTCL